MTTNVNLYKFSDGRVSGHGQTVWMYGVENYQALSLGDSGSQINVRAPFPAYLAGLLPEGEVTFTSKIGGIKVQNHSIPKDVERTMGFVPSPESNEPGVVITQVGGGELTDIVLEFQRARKVAQRDKK